MLYIMRHGRTDWNDAYKLQGRTDIPLNDAGRRMAQEAAQRYREVSFDVCFCSPLIRARETAEIFLKGRDTPILFDDRLKEMCFGVCEGSENVFENRYILCLRIQRIMWRLKVQRALRSCLQGQVPF